MRSKLGTGFCLAVFFIFLVFGNLFAQGQFTRLAEIPLPETDKNTGGIGAIIAGVDFDNDGKLEIYMVNDNWNDAADELIPRIYKLEKNGENWDLVWQAVAPVPMQNTWPAFIAGDIDKDNKTEIYWGVVNYTDATTNPNPKRILVYETAGDGSDVMGISDGAGGYLPNASWTITDSNNVNIRPTRFVIADPDNDGTEELIFSDRAGNTGGYYCGIASVSNIPDNGDGSETWTLEVSGLDYDLKAGTTENKWDVAVIGSNVYSFCEKEVTKFYWDGSSWIYEALSPMAGGSSFCGLSVVDLNNDGVKEIITAVYDWGTDAFKAINLLQEDGDTLKLTQLASVMGFWPSGTRGPMGTDYGDIDQDGNLDFVWGSRASTPNAGIFRLAYRGGDITNPANYEFSIIDSLYATGGIWNVIDITNLDSDPYLEVLYGSSTDAGEFPNLGTKPLVVLDYAGTVEEFDNLVIAGEVLLNGVPPAGLMFKPGRILDNGKTIWFCGVNGSTRETYVFRSIDGGATFTHNATPIPGRAAQMDAFDATSAIVGTAEGKIWKTGDGDVTWNEKYSYDISVIAPGWFDGVRVLNDNVAVAYGDMEPNGNVHFARTEDKGDTWVEITGIDYKNAAYGYYTWGLAACNVGSSIWCTATTMEYDSSFVFRSYNAGVDWQSFKIPNDVISTYPRAIAFTDDNNGMIAARGGFVIKTTDGGATWTATNDPDTSSSSYVNGVAAVPNSNIIFGMNDIGAYYTMDLGATWGKLNIPTDVESDNFIGGVFLNKDFGYFFTYGGKVLRFENQITGVSEPSVDRIPSDFYLSQNYPNPFNPTTTIEFRIQKSETVKLTIYNLQGQEIAKLIDARLAAGSYKAYFDAKNLPSGLYFYTLEAGQSRVQKKMILSK